MIDKKSTSIIIIGAGAAGLSAASKLLENGFNNVQILEAEPRIGGRIHSVYFGENYIDLGARWCHGENKNIVYSKVNQLNLLIPTNVPEVFFHSSGLEIDDQFGDELWKIIKQIYTYACHYPVEYSSCGDYCTKQYNKLVYEKFSLDKEKLKIAKDAIDFFEHFTLIDESCRTWYDSTAQSDLQLCEGEQNLNWQGKGYKTFFEILLKKSTEDPKISEVEKKVICNKEVSKICWNTRRQYQGVTILCSDGSQYVADHVILTASLGVLKENMDRMFSPVLPVKKRNAIEVMGYGAVMKIAVYYSKKWWDDNCPGFNLIWSKNDRENASLDFPEGPRHKNRSWITYISYIIKADNNPNVFMFWVTGPLVPKIELMSENLLRKGVTYITKRFLGQNYAIPKPDEIMHSKWYTNRHFRGAYSFQTVESKRDNKSSNTQKDLSAPIKNIDGRPFVHFAGEGTHAHYFSTVHGAVESGFREADLIIKYYQNLTN